VPTWRLCVDSQATNCLLRKSPYFVSCSGPPGESIPTSSQTTTGITPPGASTSSSKTDAVEVLTPGGNWSSFPPHKHDEHSEDEVPLEEIYFFKIRGDAGFGFHRTYTLDGEIDATVTVRDGDVFLIPRGYHGPCVAMPGHPMYYLNVMAGPAERAWRVCLDPAHEWLAELLEAAGPDPRCPMTTAEGLRVPRDPIG
jgi:5-deoxy-glucuronate isomerase